jgi:flagellar basal-body rod modification protein FlgD
MRKKTELNQEDFLTLMITQLKNQDPFKPLDPSQYVASWRSSAGLGPVGNEQADHAR